MQVLSVRIDGQLYALPTAAIVQVVPLIVLRSVPKSPSYLAGLCNYRGKIAAVVDLGQLLAAAPCRRRWSTRIVFVRHPQSNAGVLGIMAEGVTETLDLDEAQIEAGAAIPLPETPYLGPVVQHEFGMIQLLDLGPLILEGEPLAELEEVIEWG